MTSESVEETIKPELPAILRADPDFRAYFLKLTQQAYADRSGTHDRFREVLGDLRRDR